MAHLDREWQGQRRRDSTTHVGEGDGRGTGRAAVVRPSLAAMAVCALTLATRPAIASPQAIGRVRGTVFDSLNNRFLGDEQGQHRLHALAFQSTTSRCRPACSPCVMQRGASTRRGT